MANKKLNIASQVRLLVEKPITDMGYSLWDVTFYKDSADPTLEIAVEKKGGISLDDCSLITKQIEPLIDELDPIMESYCLMVSSAGYDRELNTALHIEIAMSRELPVTFKLFTVFEGKKEYCGIIKSFDNDIITISEAVVPVRETVLPRKLVAKMSAFFIDDVSTEIIEL